MKIQKNAKNLKLTKFRFLIKIILIDYFFCLFKGFSNLFLQLKEYFKMQKQENEESDGSVSKKRQYHQFAAQKNEDDDTFKQPDVANKKIKLDEGEIPKPTFGPHAEKKKDINELQEIVEECNTDASFSINLTNKDGLLKNLKDSDFEQKNEGSEPEDSNKLNDISSFTHAELRNSKNGLSMNFPVNEDNKNLFVKAPIGDLKQLLFAADLILQNQQLEQKSAGSEEIDKYSFQIIDLEQNKPYRKFRVQNGDQQNMDVIQWFSPNKHPKGKKIGEQFHCDQQMFRRIQTDGHTTFMWVLHNLGGEPLFNKIHQFVDDNEQVRNYRRHYIQSGLFESSGGMLWRLRFEPGNWPNHNVNGQTQQKPSQAKICIQAVPSPLEIKEGLMDRRVDIQFTLFNQGHKRVSLHDWKQIFEFQCSGEEMSVQTHTLQKFCNLSNPQIMRQNGNAEQLPIEFKICHLLPTRSKEDKIAEVQPFKGLFNEGTTCYLNSLMQTLYFIRAFRNAIYKMPTIQEESAKKNKISPNSIPFCIQRIFYNLQLSSSDCVRTHELLQAFGWSIREANEQHDVNEFNCKLSDVLENHMINTEVQGTYQKLFQGTLQSVIKCINVDIERTRDEAFYTLSLSLQGNRNIQESILQYVASENLDGDNKYDTDDPILGKQDAKKFYRFKKLPPVLQISLNRFYFDYQQLQTIKNNQKFEFSEILDFDSILAEQKDKNDGGPLMGRPGQQQNANGEPCNRYHLHSILVHNGTINVGHYYAFIRPFLNDRWFTFNDANVFEVTKQYAFSQGYGGDITEFKVYRHGCDEIPESTSCVMETFQEKCTNAYMLIYVRESERRQIMEDSLSLDQQIPKPIQAHFQIEEKYRNQIYEDSNVYEKFKKCFILSHETILHNRWDGPLISQNWRAANEQDGYAFENVSSSHHVAYVNNNVSVNEFIHKLYNRFFKDAPGLEIEDVWLYRIQIIKQNNSDVYKQSFQLMTYDPVKRHDIPLFTQKPALDAQQWESDSKQSEKWKKTLSKVYFYVDLNPKKLNPATGKPHPLFSIRNGQQLQEQKNHYQEFMDYIKKSGMHNGDQYCNMYFMLSNSNAFFFSEYANDQNNAKQIGQQNSIDHQKNDNYKFRKHFLFEYDEEVDNVLNKEHEMLVKKQDESPKRAEDGELLDEAELDGEEEENKSSVETYLCFIKYVDLKNNVLVSLGRFFQDSDKPLCLDDQKEALKEAFVKTYRDESDEGEIDFDLEDERQVQVFVETSSFTVIKQDYFGEIKDSEDVVLKKHENQYIPHLYMVDLKAAKKVPVSNYIRTDGLSLNICITDQQKPMEEKVEGQNQQKVRAQKSVVSQYIETYHSLCNRVYVNLCEFQDNHINQKEWTENRMGVFEFNFLDPYEDIAQKVVNYYNENAGPRRKIRWQQIQFFNCEFEIVSYADYGSMTTGESTSEVLSQLLTRELYLNFLILEYPMTLDKADANANVKYQLFMEDEIQNHGDNPFYQMTFPRKDIFSSFIEQHRLVNKHLMPEEGTSRILFLVMPIHRETGTITGIKMSSEKLETHIGKKNYLSYRKLMPSFKLMKLNDDDINHINMIIKRINQRDVCFAFVQLYDQFRQKIGEQFLVPFSHSTETLLNMYKKIRKRILKIHMNPNNSQLHSKGQIDLAMGENFFSLYLIQYHPFVSRSSSGRIINNSGNNNYNNPAFEQLDINSYGQHKFAPNLIENESEERYNMQPNQSLYRFIYFGAVVKIIQKEQVNKVVSSAELQENEAPESNSAMADDPQTSSKPTPVDGDETTSGKGVVFKIDQDRKAN